MNTYDEKIEAFRSLLVAHNLAIEDQLKRKAERGEGETHSVNPITRLVIDQVIIRLVTLGASTSESLAQCSYEDLEGIGLPKILAKQAASLFRGGPSETSRGFVSPRTADRMSYEELLSRYNPKEDDAISRKLKELGKGCAFIVFLENGGVDTTTSVRLLDEIRKGFGERPSRICTVDGGVPHEIFLVGQSVDNYVDENPIYFGRALRPDGTCDQLNRSWAGVPLEVRQLIRLVEVPMTIDKAHELLDIALELDAFDTITKRYSAARFSFENLKKQHRLPLLRIELGKQSNRQSKLVTKFQWYEKERKSPNDDRTQE